MQSRKLTVRRTFQAPPEEVFRAFVSLEAIKEWWAPKGHVTLEVQVDVRVGGQFRLVTRSETGSRVVYEHGSFMEISPPNKLVFTHVFERRSTGVPFAEVGLADYQTLVTVEFHARAGATEVVLVQEAIPTAAAEDVVRVGWQGTLDKLAEYLGGIGGTGTRRVG